MAPPKAGSACATFLRLDSAYNQITYMEDPRVNPPGVISTERLLLPY
jgi:hypothetical protein